MFNHHSATVVEVSLSSAWPTPASIDTQAVRDTAELDQRWHHLTLDLPLRDGCSTAADCWPTPAEAPQGPPSTWVADDRRLANMLAFEEDRHIAALYNARARWSKEHAKQCSAGDGAPLTLVERRRQVSQRARQRRKEEEERALREQRCLLLRDTDAGSTEPIETAEMGSQVQVEPWAGQAVVRVHAVRASEGRLATDDELLASKTADTLVATGAPAPAPAAAASSQSAATPAAAPASAPAAAPASSPASAPAAVSAAAAPAGSVQVAPALAQLASASAPGLALNASLNWATLSSAEASGALGSGPLAIETSQLKLGKSIAEGAFAEVFRGLLWGQKVAVKQLKPDREGADAAQLERELRHETRILAALSHPSILTLIGFTAAPAQIVLEVRAVEALRRALARLP